jgi:2-methylcitrate dehydratase PrpD
MTPGPAPGDGVARFVTETPLDRIPTAALERARDGLIDTVGAALGGSRLPVARAAVAWALDESGAGVATLLGAGRRAGLSQAAFANAVLACALDFDDGHIEAITHPGAPVAPPALAAAEARARSGRELLGAVVIGYEVAIRAAAILNARPQERSYGSGAPGAYGAAASVARLLGLDATRTGHALGITWCHLPLASVDRIRWGAMTKESVGWGALTGTVAALLAEKGFTGPPTTLDAPHHPDGSAAGLLADLGQRYRITEAYVKGFPACLMTHTAVEAALDLRQRHRLRAEDVAGATVWVQRGAAALDDPAPRSPEGAQYSVPYTVAAALVDGELTVRQMLEGLGDRRILDLAARVVVRHDPALDAEYPSRRPARVSLRTVDGAAYEHEVRVLRGSPAAPLSAAELDAKFLGLAEPVGGGPWARRLLATLRDLGPPAELGPLWALLAHGGAPPARDGGAPGSEPR